MRVLSRRPDLDVVRLGRAEADIAGAKFYDAIVQAEQLQHLLRIRRQRLQFRKGSLRRGDLHQLDLVELVHANEPARAEDRSAGLASEARRVGDVANRQLIEAQDFLAMKIGHGHLGGGREVEIVALAAVELFLEFGELGRADESLGIHEKRRTHLGVTVFAGVQIEQEIDQRPLQPRTGTDVEGKSAAADLRGALEIEKAEFFTELDVALRREREGQLFAPNPDDRIVFRRSSDRAMLVREIGDVEQQGALRGIELLRLVFELRDFFTESAHLRFDCRTVFALRLLRPDFFADSLAVRLELLESRLRGAALLIAG